MRAPSVLVLLFAAGLARAEPALTLPPDPPRWRVRAALTTGVGGSRDGSDPVTVFPTTLELGVRLFGPLSLTVAGQGVVSGAEYTACGKERRPHAALGTAGLRVDFSNNRSGSWLSPFLEAHGGVGGQEGGREVAGLCNAPGVFGTGGGRVGIDAWLGGTVAVTVAAGYDWLPIAGPFSVSLGASFVLR